ncbi:hypothetical protein [Roseibium alexandrii]|uniref:Uncharacterized protein n=2 Tax=Roseibium alexandrii TaxID=388408 RepID=A0A0M7AN87_9HYPH|nr:hypothetical protein [Roseibium alexandrii]EEE46507.1 hypothetical protein SADFL11_3796 [Roseibium alexandrii DFL-11]CTQ75892.1 hypothetical protein LAX5112_04399 [Roseibium alexandrii]
MNTRAKFKQVDVKRAIKAVVDAGQPVQEIEITSEGTIRIIVNNDNSLAKGPEPDL